MKQSEWLYSLAMLKLGAMRWGGEESRRIRNDALISTCQLVDTWISTLRIVGNGHGEKVSCIASSCASSYAAWKTGVNFAFHSAYSPQRYYRSHLFSCHIVPRLCSTVLIAICLGWLHCNLEVHYMRGEHPSQSFVCKENWNILLKYFELRYHGLWTILDCLFCITHPLQHKIACQSCISHSSSHPHFWIEVSWDAYCLGH